MADRSDIAWTDSTFNPWMGCTKVSQGCKYCYAETLMDARYGKVEWGPQGTRLQTSVPYWKKPLLWNRQEFVECSVCGWRGVYGDPKSCQHAMKGSLRPVRRRVFCASLADVFEDNKQVFEWRMELWDLIGETPNLDWLLLTKRPQHISAFSISPIPDNVWLGASVESQEHFQTRVDHLLSVRASVHFLSVEPMIGPVRIPKRTIFPEGKRLHWVIVGGESGKDCRPMALEWAEDIRDDCRAGGLRFFMKQLGGHPNKRDKMTDFPDDLQIREFPA